MIHRPKLFILAILVYGVFLLLYVSKFGFNASAMLELSTTYEYKYGASFPPGLIVQTETPGHDGQYYYMVASDPLHRHINIEGYRYQRIIYPLISYLASLGSLTFLPLAMLMVNMACILIGGEIFLAITKRLGVGRDMALLWYFNPVYVVSIVRGLVEPMMILFCLAAVLFLLDKRYWISSFLLAGAIFTKEHALTIAIIFPLYFVFRKQKKEAVIFLIPFALYSVWQFVLWKMLGYVPLITSVFHLTNNPLTFLWGAVAHPGVAPWMSRFYYDPMGLAGVVFTLLMAVYLIRNMKSRWTLFMVLAAVQVCFILSVRAFTAIDISRYSAGLFLFSLLVFAERKERFPIALGICMMLLSGYAVFERLILSNFPYMISL